jgi:N-acetylmuramoyl-L-alanine amidase
MKAALIEVDFISNENCEKAMSDDSNIKNIAEVIKDNLLELGNVSRNEGNLYRVCIGSYRSKSNAINAMNMARGKGFSDVYII